MDETTTPDAVDQETGELDSHPENTTEQPADDKTTETPTPEGNEVPDPELDKKIEWAKNKGIPTEDLSPTALKAIEVAMNGEKDFHESRQPKNLKEAIGESETQAEVDPDMAAFRKEMAETRFYKAHPDAEGQEDALAAVAKDYPYLRDLYAAGYSAELSSQALKAMWEIHKGRNVEGDIKAAEKRGYEQAKQEIGKASTAGTPPGNASTRTSTEKTADEKLLEIWS